MSQEEGQVITLNEDLGWGWTSENAESITVANGVLTLSVITDNDIIYIALDDVSVRSAQIQTIPAAKQEALEWAAQFMRERRSLFHGKGAI